ncbi:poly(A) RNA polymerase, mitochondrial-like isoform X2 [Tachypleus tridentatus]|uniref:poly(A) RNA polymerase, mitochondrial-like isoform X2 n=1 Tax=Tachypleus tridentatus TaxID=6853 RepID=UPI003FD372A3
MNQELCDICNLFIPSGESNRKTHYSGKKHIANLAFKHQREKEAQRTIYVEGFPPNMDELQLSDFFSKIGKVRQVIIDKEMRRFAFVKFENESSVAAALGMKNSFIIHRYQLQVKPRKLKSDSLYKRAELLGSKPFSVPVDHKTLVDKFISEDTMDNQMVMLRNTLKLSKEEILERENFCRFLQDALQEYFPGCTLCLYGSSVNGFGIKTCDIDMFLDINHLDFSSSDTSKCGDLPSVHDIMSGLVSADTLHKMPEEMQLKFIIKVIRKIPKCRNVLFIPSKRCPIIHFLHSGFNVHCDISSKSSLVIHNSHLLRLYGLLDPRVTPLIMTLHYWAKRLILTCSGHKLTSYAFNWMIIFFLQSCDPPVLPSVLELRNLTDDTREVDGIDCAFCNDPSKISPSANELSGEELLKRFFSFYSTFDFKKWVISPRFGQVFDKKKFSTIFPNLGHFVVAPLSIQDPFDLNHSIAANVTEDSLLKLVQKMKQGQTICESQCFSSNSNSASKLWGIPILFDLEKYTDRIKSYVPGSQFNVTMGTVTFSIQFQPYKMHFCFKSLPPGNLSDWNLWRLWMYKTSYVILDVFQKGLMFECKVRDYMRTRWLKKKKVQPSEKYGESRDKRRQANTETDERSSKHLCVTHDNETKKELEHHNPIRSEEHFEQSNVTDNIAEPTEWDEFEELIFGASAMEVDENWKEGESEESNEETQETSNEITSGSAITSQSSASREQTNKESMASTSSENISTDSRKTLLKIFCKAFYRTWEARKKHKADFVPTDINDPLELEQYISQQIINKATSKPSKPILDFICRTREKTESEMWGIEIELKPKICSKEFLGSISLFLNSYIIRMTEKCMSVN